MEGSRELCEPTNMNLPDETRGTTSVCKQCAGLSSGETGDVRGQGTGTCAPHRPPKAWINRRCRRVHPQLSLARRVPQLSCILWCEDL
jgi:hypothetical protein